MGDIRVVIQRTRKGYAIRSFDFTTNVFEVFEGEGAFKGALKHCESKNYKILNSCTGTPIVADKEKGQR